MTNNTKTIQTAAWVTVGATMLHSTGATVENRKISAEDRAWIIVLSDGSMLRNHHTGKVQAYTTPDGAALVYEWFLTTQKGA